MDGDTSSDLDPRQLRALAHPLRVRLLGLLRLDGPSTATQLAQRLGESSGATSYHLRQLAAHGVVEDAPGRGRGRERWWRASSPSYRVRVEDFVQDPELLDALNTYIRDVLREYFTLTAQWLSERASWGKEWMEAATTSDYALRLTPDRLQALVTEMQQVIARFAAEPDSPEAEQVLVQLSAFPRRSPAASGPVNRDEEPGR